jgi:L-lactate dehydrogenase complex protein LldG
MSNSREEILKAIRQNKPAETPLPEIPDFHQSIDRLAAFKQVTELGGGAILEPTDLSTAYIKIAQVYPEAKVVVSTLPDIMEGTFEVTKETAPVDLKDVDLAIIKGELGVAENGAVWVSEDRLPRRVLPFITQHLVIVLEKDKIVENMHQAYAQIDVSSIGYGVFIAGPSKTADIEQSLVKGAQGARSLLVVLV